MHLRFESQNDEESEALLLVRTFIRETKSIIPIAKLMARMIQSDNFPQIVNKYELTYILKKYKGDILYNHLDASGDLIKWIDNVVDKLETSE